MKRQQFLHMIREYSRLAQRQRKDYGDLVDWAASRYLAAETEAGADEEATGAMIAATVEREYPMPLRTYPKP